MKKRENNGQIMKTLGKYSFVIVFILIFLVYMISSSGLTWGGVMNIFRHSAVVGIMALGMPAEEKAAVLLDDLKWEKVHR